MWLLESVVIPAQAEIQTTQTPLQGGGYAASAGFNAASGVPSFQGSGTS
jgi:hypothetical protein